MCDHVRVKIASVRAMGCVVVAALAIGACSSGSTESNHKQIRLGQGQAGGTSWRLVASSDVNGDLCMDVFGQHGADLGEGGCGFGPAPADTDPSDYGTAYLADETALFYGPAPSKVVRVVARRDPISVTHGSRTAAPTAAPSSSAPGPSPQCKVSDTPTASAPVNSRLPHWAHPGKWFVLHIGGDPACYKVIFYGHTGRTIPQTNF